MYGPRRPMRPEDVILEANAANPDFAIPGAGLGRGGARGRGRGRGGTATMANAGLGTGRSVDTSRVYSAMSHANIVSISGTPELMPCSVERSVMHIILRFTFCGRTIQESSVLRACSSNRSRCFVSFGQISKHASAQCAVFALLRNKSLTAVDGPDSIHICINTDKAGNFL